MLEVAVVLMFAVMFLGPCVVATSVGVKGTTGGEDGSAVEPSCLSD